MIVRSWLLRVVVAIAVVSGSLSAQAAPAKPANPAKPAAKPWVDMDRGPYLTASIESPLPERGMTPKGLAIRVDPAGPGYVLFDTDLLRYSAGWTGGSIDFRGVDFDGAHRAWPKVKGEQVFGSLMKPGWAKAGRFEDPRQVYPSTDYAPQPPSWQRRAYGPLPRDWAKYRGLYLHGERVVLSYDVAGTPVLDSPGWEAAAGGIFTRTLNVEKSSADLVVHILDRQVEAGGVGPGTDAADVKRQMKGSAKNAEVLLGDPSAEATSKKGPALRVAAVGASAEMTWELVDGSQLRLHIPASATPARIKILIAPAKADAAPFLAAVKASPAPENLSELTHGGPAHWSQTVTTSGRPGVGEQAYVIDTLSPPNDNPWKARMRFGGFDFFKDGRSAAICTWDGDVWIVQGLDEKLDKLTWRRIATGLFQPLGLKIVPDDKGREQIYVSCRDQITRLHDLNGDGEVDFYECFNNDHQVTEHFHEFAMGLQTDAEGNFYYAKSGRHALDAVVPQHGTIVKVSRDGSKTEIVCNGFRAANGLGMGPYGEIAATDQEGFWTPANRINLTKAGGFYGNLWSYNATGRTAADGYDPPLCWLPVKLDRSPAEDLWVTSDKWGPLKGSLIHTSYGTGKLFLVPYEKVDGVPQGGVVPFPGVNFPTGVMRARFSPADGQLYACGLVGWSSNTAEPGGFYRVRYTGKPVYLPVALSATKEGVRLTFPEPLDKESATDAGNYAVQQWQYLWSKNYGSAAYSVADPSKKGQDEVKLTGVTLSADRKSVLLQIPGMRPVMQMAIDVNITAADGKPVKVLVHNTINKVPG